MAPGARNKFGVPMFEHQVFWKQMYCIEESICDIIGTFRRPPVIRRQGHWVPLAPRYAPGSVFHDTVNEVPNKSTEGTSEPLAVTVAHKLWLAIHEWHHMIPDIQCRISICAKETICGSKNEQKGIMTCRQLVRQHRMDRACQQRSWLCMSLVRGLHHQMFLMFHLSNAMTTLCFTDSC